MVLERVGGGVGGRKHLDVESLEKSPRAKFGFRELLGYLIVN
jgi:hypothetical protein